MDNIESKTIGHSDKFTDKLKVLIRFCVRIMAVLMTFVIFMGVLDIIWVIVGKLKADPMMLLTIGDMLSTFGAFMAVLIAIEIFVNITIYLREDVIHVKIVLATALMAIARKVIILDLKDLEPQYLFGIAAIVFAMGFAYWLVIVSPGYRKEQQPEHPS